MSFPDLFDWFDQVYIVNLPHRDDRRAETIAEFARVGVTVPNAKINFFEATRPTEKGEFPSLGSLGNFISQTNVLKDAINNGHSRILICEDDLQLNDLPADTLAAVLTDLRQTSWNIAALGYLEPYEPPSDHTGLSAWTGGTRGTQFWAIQGDAIAAFHDYLNLVRSRPSGHPEGGSMFFDGAFNMVRTIVPGVTFRIATPCLAGQRASRTDIHDLKFYDRIEPFRSIVGALRKLRNRTPRA
ncbi:hypothetical protein [Shimia abyssi]|uniref:Glycosyl transferase family 25 n=1 Tax=Shimia abyssi TaxID=1662395 RepID=A0A2P8F911_9RHOB|nr:hypothetical protein [Shimia abyssi]PSL18207.1 hypothetical protein CLV88_112131 [Shimia abyssi]